MNYSQLTAAQQAAIDTYVASLAVFGQLSHDLTLLSNIDNQYVALASAALALLAGSEYSFANFASTNGNAAAPVITSASHNFTADEVGNYFNVTAGTSWTPGLYKIVSVAANAATLDRACGTVASLSSGTANVLAMVPNKTNLAGTQPTISRADVVSMASHIEVVTPLNDANHRQLWVKVVGPSNLG
jgi:hypothetical protein